MQAPDGPPAKRQCVPAGSDADPPSLLPPSTPPPPVAENDEGEIVCLLSDEEEDARVPNGVGGHVGWAAMDAWSGPDGIEGGAHPPRGDVNVQPRRGGGPVWGAASGAAHWPAAAGGGDTNPWSAAPAGAGHGGPAGGPASFGALPLFAPPAPAVPQVEAGGLNPFFSSTLYGDIGDAEVPPPPGESAAGPAGAEAPVFNGGFSPVSPPHVGGAADAAPAGRQQGAGAASAAGAALPDGDGTPHSTGRRGSSVGVGSPEDPIDVDELLDEQFEWMRSRRSRDSVTPRKPAAAAAAASGSAGPPRRGTPARPRPRAPMTEQEEEAALEARIGGPSRGSRSGGPANGGGSSAGCGGGGSSAGAGAASSDAIILEDYEEDAGELDKLEMATDGGDSLGTMAFARSAGRIGGEEFGAQYVQQLLGQNHSNADASREGDTPFEMTVSLLRHQKRALAWMINREQSSSAGPRGGILADEMGLGKTLSMVALILRERPPPPEDGKAAKLRTLIVAPLSVLQVWREEFFSRLHDSFRPKVLIYHGSSRPKDPAVLADYDIVITSYALVSQESPKEVYEEDAEGQSVVRKVRGALFKLKWFRVVLDEAQVIKNRRSLQARGAYLLRADRRWCLSGTPIQNSVDDIYSLFLFLRYYIVDTYSEWNKLWKKRLNSGIPSVRERAFKRFQVVLGTVLLRRTKGDTIDGVPLLTLPPKNVALRALQFSADERAIYQALENKTRVQFNKYVKAGTVMANLFSVLVLLLRLRQACSHPHLITKDDGFSREELERAATRIARGASLLSNLPEPVQKRLIEVMAPDNESDEGKVCPICFDGFGPEAIVTSCGHFSCSTCNTSWSAESDTCPQCRQSLADVNAKLNLSLIRQEVHAVYEQRKEAAAIGGPQGSSKGKGKGKGKAPARLVGKGNSGDVERFDEMAIDALAASKRKASEAVAAGVAGGVVIKPNLAGIKTDALAADEEEDEEEPPAKVDATAAAAAGSAKPDEKGGRKFLLSTKIQALMDELALLRETKPDEKALVYSQWTAMLDLIEVPMEQDGFRYTRIDGTMKMDDRTAAIDEFKTRSDCSVILMSLHAAGTGLTLTNANHVFMMDMYVSTPLDASALVALPLLSTYRRGVSRGERDLTVVLTSCGCFSLLALLSGPLCFFSRSLSPFVLPNLPRPHQPPMSLFCAATVPTNRLRPSLVVVHSHRWWNPAVEAQAVGRCHRIGQTKPVHVYRLHIGSSVETKILEIQAKKEEMASGALGVEGVQTLGRQRLTLEEVMSLFGRFSGEDANAETAAQRAARHAQIVAAAAANHAGTGTAAAAAAAPLFAPPPAAPALLPPPLAEAMPMRRKARRRSAPGAVADPVAAAWAHLQQLQQQGPALGSMQQVLGARQRAELQAPLLAMRQGQQRMQARAEREQSAAQQAFAQVQQQHAHAQVQAHLQQQRRQQEQQRYAMVQRERAQALAQAHAHAAARAQAPALAAPLAGGPFGSGGWLPAGPPGAAAVGAEPTAPPVMQNMPPPLGAAPTAPPVMQNMPPVAGVNWGAPPQLPPFNPGQ